MNATSMVLGACLAGPGPVTDFDAMVAAAQSIQQIGFDLLCLAERPGLDPIALAAGLAAVTNRIALIPTCTAPYHQPYNLARRLGSIDHISGGRLGWSLRAVPEPQEALRFGHVALTDPDTAHTDAGELAAVVEGLWDSWDDDAFLRDKVSGLYFDRTKFHWLEHQGRRFKVRGPLDTARPPQGRLPLMISGDTALAEDLAIAAAEILLLEALDLAQAQDDHARIERRLSSAGRAPGSLKLLCRVTPGLGGTPWNGPAVAIAETMATWFANGATDGFVLHLPDAPAEIAEIGAQMLPVLAPHRLSPAAMTRGTLRQTLGLRVAQSRYAARVA